MAVEDGALVLTARNASIEDLVALLRGQQTQKVDVVAPASAMVLLNPSARSRQE